MVRTPCDPNRNRVISRARQAMLARRAVAIQVAQTHRRLVVPVRMEPKTLGDALRSGRGWDTEQYGPPTSTRPGTIERMEVYRWRIEEGFSIFHPQDRPQDVFWEKFQAVDSDADDGDDWEEVPCSN